MSELILYIWDCLSFNWGWDSNVVVVSVLIQYIEYNIMFIIVIRLGVVFCV